MVAADEVRIASIWPIQSMLLAVNTIGNNCKHIAAFISCQFFQLTAPDQELLISATQHLP